DTGGERLEVQLLRLFNDRMDDVDLGARFDLGVDEGVDALELRARSHRGLDALAAGRQLVDDGELEVAVHGKSQRSRNRRGGHDEDVGRFGFGEEALALLDAESKLLVDNGEAEGVELHFLFED